MSAREVLWDGRRNGPGGAHLLTAEERRREAPRQASAERALPRQAIAYELTQAPRTLRELTARTGIDGHRLNSALHAMKRDGQVTVIEIRRRAGLAGKGAGRIGEYVYALAPRS